MPLDRKRYDYTIDPGRSELLMVGGKSRNRNLARWVACYMYCGQRRNTLYSAGLQFPGILPFPFPPLLERLFPLSWFVPVVLFIWIVVV